MRYIIIFVTTLILLLFVLFYNPYLGTYKDQLTIEYDFNESDYIWNYKSDCKSMNINKINDNKWVLKAVSNGLCSVSFEYNNINDNSRKYLIKYIFKVKNNKIYWLDGEGTGLLNFPNPY